MAYEVLPDIGWAENALQNPNVQRFLNTIALAEGTAKPGVDPYRVNFGGSQIGDLAAHPNIRKEFTQTDGKKNYTTAAGKYQFLKSTWDDAAQKMGLSDFGPRSQDLAAVHLLKQNGSLDALLAGDMKTAVQRSGRTWASLPSSPYAQPRRSQGFIEKALTAAIPSAQAKETPMQGRYELLDDEPAQGRYELIEDGPVAASQPTPDKQAGKMSRLEKIGTGMADPIHGGAQLLTNLLPGGVVEAGNALNNWLADNTGLVARLPEGGVDQQVREREAAYQAQRAAAGESGFDGYRVIGNVASPANAALAARGIGAATTGARVVGGAVTGGASALMNPVTQGDFGSEKAKQVATGAAFGAAVPAITAGIGRMISPNASRNVELAALRREGVQPTVGQSLGGRWNAAEEKLTGIPLVGDMVAKRRGEALDQFNKAAINRTTAPIGVKIDEAGRAGIDRAQTAISQAYDDALGQIKGVKFDRQFGQEFGQLQQLTRGLTPPMRNKFDATVRNVLGSRSKTGAMTAETFKRVDSELGNIAGKFQGSAVASEKEFGDAVMQLKSLLTQQASRSNPVAANALSKADSAYAQLVRVERAANAAGQSNGVFTPAQLGSAVRMADRSARHRMNASGNALMQDLSYAGQAVLGNKVPDSGTAGRLLNIGTGAAAVTNLPLTGAGLLGGGLLYTKGAQRALAGLLASRPESAEAIRQSLLKGSPGLVPLGSQVGIGLLNYPSP